MKVKKEMCSRRHDIVVRYILPPIPVQTVSSPPQDPQLELQQTSLTRMPGTPAMHMGSVCCEERGTARGQQRRWRLVSTLYPKRLAKTESILRVNTVGIHA